MGRPDTSRWPGWWADTAWMLFAVANFWAIAVFRTWETVPFHFVWVSMTLLYGFRVWSLRRTIVVLTVVAVTSTVLLIVDVVAGAQPVDELAEVPLMSAMFVAMVWHARRRLVAQEQAQTLAESNLRLLEQNRQLVQDASHELRTPITVALGHAEALSREAAGTPAGEASRVVVEELGRLRRIADRLLALACSERPDFLLLGPVELEPLVLRVLQRWSHVPRVWRLGRVDEVIVEADGDALLLALDALIENAVKSTTATDTIELALRDEGDQVCIEVSDTGRGMTEHEQQSAFTRFATAGRGTAAGGTGLGLAIVSAVAQAHGGTVDLSSAEGAGALLRIRLPAQERPMPAHRAPLGLVSGLTAPVMARLETPERRPGSSGCGPQLDVGLAAADTWE